MANTRQSTKRARQANDRQARNVIVRSSTRTTVKSAMDAINSKDVAKAKTAYTAAIRALAKSASKGAFPKGRAARKTSRLTMFAQKNLPAIFGK